MELTLLIDADVLRYQLAFSNTKSFQFDDDDSATEITNPEKAKADLEGYIEDLVDTLGATDFLLPLSVSTNFRKDLYPAYKDNRAGKPKPSLWSAVDGFLHEMYADKIITRDCLEGDDILGLLATHPKPKRCPGKRIIVSIDKDMQTIPSRLYNPQKPDLGTRTIGIHDANLFWMKQTLMGDATDNYPGCKGIGPKKADELLNPIHEACLDGDAETHLSALWLAVVDAFMAKGFSDADALTQARLARILRHGDYNYNTNEVNLWKPL
ncbi:phage exonuclease [Dyella silvatica]|uniref:phage exonuclease n=1 Tax=Dyella silvatica TaxID=2992128 RepID=UPI00224CD9C5|nr:phage exonuclease [Dyella silvatica]